MARLNDPTPAGDSESFEVFKKRFIRQNREIVRLNSTQSIKIRNLEIESTRLLTENIELREQVIKLQSSLDRRERNKVVVKDVEATKRQLEGKMAEIQEILKSLGQAIASSPQAKAPPKQKAYIVSPEQRSWKGGLSFSEVMGAKDPLPIISEDSRSRRNSLNVGDDRRASINSNESRNIDENRRNSINFEEITLLPTPATNDADSDEDLKPPTSSLLDVRPRRRRDSRLPTDFESSNPAAPSKAEPQPTVDSQTKPRKRRYEEREQVQVEPSQPQDFKFTKVSQRTTGTTKQTTEASPVMLGEPEQETEHEDDVEMNEIEKIVEAGRRAVRLDPIEPRELFPPRETVTLSATPMMGRRALGPKSTNTDPSNSPLKQAVLKNSLPKEGDLEKPEKAIYDSKIRDAEILPDADAGTGRPSRRTKSSVNYALPNLRDKMRREDKNSEAKGEGRRRTTAGRSRNKDSVEDIVIKQEEPEAVEGVVGKQRFDLPILPNATLAVDAGEVPRAVKETGIGGLLERKPSRENVLEQYLPSSVTTHRKRRTSSLHQSSLMDLEQEGTNGRESRRKTVSFDPASTAGGEEGQSRTRAEGTSLKRRQIVHSHLPPSSSPADDVEEASAALNEVVRGSRRITLGGTTKGIRSARSQSNLVGDENEMEDIIPTSSLGMGTSRRRSMML